MKKQCSSTAMLSQLVLGEDLNLMLSCGALRHLLLSYIINVDLNLEVIIPIRFHPEDFSGLQASLNCVNRVLTLLSGPCN